MYAKGGRGGRAARLLFGAMTLCLLRDAAANICPEFGADDTIVQSAPGCQNDVEIPFTMKSNLFAQTEIVIFDVSPDLRFLVLLRLFAACL